MVSVVILAVGLVAANDAFVDSRIEASADVLPQCLSRFRDYPPDAGVLGFPRCLWENPFKQNPDFWLKDLDLTCASPWNDSYGRFRAGTAISKRHIIFAQHFPLAVGTRMSFVGVNGDTSHYTIKAVKGLDKVDLMVGLLDYELTPDVHPAKILPVDFEKWMPQDSVWPVITLTQNEHAYLTELRNTYLEAQKKRLWMNTKPRTPGSEGFRRPIISGDSGNPAFMIYYGQPILLYCILGDGVGDGPMIHEFRVQVQKAMDDLCPGYKLDTFDFDSVGKAD